MFSEKAKSFANEAKANVNYAMTRMTTGAMLATSTLLMTVYAEDDIGTDLVTKVKNIASKAYGLIVGVSSFVAAFFVAVCLFNMMLSKDEKKVNSSMDWLKRIIVCWVCIFLVSALFNWLISNLGLSSGTTLQING